MRMNNIFCFFYYSTIFIGYTYNTVFLFNLYCNIVIIIIIFDSSQLDKRIDSKKEFLHVFKIYHLNEKNFDPILSNLHSNIQNSNFKHKFMIKILISTNYNNI